MMQNKGKAARFSRLHIIGITGTIAAGKSAVCAYGRERYGFIHIDADQEAKAVFPQAEPKILAAFGETVADASGKVDRQKLARLVFSDPQALEKLNLILHPPTCRHIEQKLEKLNQKAEGSEVVLLEAIELLRSDLQDLADEIWVVDAPVKLRLQRMMENRGMSYGAASDRIRSQWPARRYKEKADVVILNPYKRPATLYKKLDTLFINYKNGDENIERNLEKGGGDPHPAGDPA